MVKNMLELREIYAKKFSYAKGNWDIFVIFIEEAFSILTENGIFSFIIPNKLIAAKYALQIRFYLATKTILEIRDYSKVKVFLNADVYPITLIMKNKNATLHRKSSFTIMKDSKSVAQTLSVNSSSIIKDTYWDIFFQPNIIFRIIEKLETSAISQNNISIFGSATVNEAYKIKEIVTEENNSNDELKFINTGTIDPYFIKWGKESCSYIKNKYFKPIVKKSNLRKISETRLKQAESAKIIVAGMSARFEAVIDLAGEYIAGKSTTIILGDKIYLKFLLGIINSKSASFWLNIKFNSLKMSGGYLNVGTNELSLLPIPTATPAQQQEIITLVDKILAAKKASAGSATNHSDSKADTTALEHKIDELVYKLYGLTEEEIAIVEGK